MMIFSCTVNLAVRPGQDLLNSSDIPDVRWLFYCKSAWKNV